MTALFDSAGDPRRTSLAVVALTAHGNFVGNAAKIPLGAVAPVGSVLTVIVDQATGKTTDWGISATLPDLSALGATVTAR